ncbi:hypothetical protein PENTCL1PPCAC_20057, partial [Pristionchus entomophagus]
ALWPSLPSPARKLMFSRDQILDGEVPGTILLVLSENGSLYVAKENNLICQAVHSKPWGSDLVCMNQNEGKWTRLKGSFNEI